MPAVGVRLRRKHLSRRKSPAKHRGGKRPPTIFRFPPVAPAVLRSLSGVVRRIRGGTECRIHVENPEAAQPCLKYCRAERPELDSRSSTGPPRQVPGFFHANAHSVACERGRTRGSRIP